MKLVFDTAASVDKINIDGLLQDGINNIIIDLDNTVARWKTFVIKDAVSEWVASAKSKGIEICLLSNNINKKRTAKIAEMLGMKNCVTLSRKPSRKAFEDALAVLQSTKEDTVVIGDQIFVDAKGANKLGMKCILVNPIYKREAFVTSVMRIAERLYGRKVRWQDKK